MTIATLALVARLTTDLMTVPAPPVHVAAVVPATGYSVSGAGELTVSVSEAQPVGTIAQGASRVPLLTMDLSASCDADITVSEVRVRHVGLGSTEDITAVYLLSDIRRVSRATRFERSGAVATLRPRALTIKKCESQRLQVVADFSREAAAGAEHGAEIRLSSDVQSTAKSVTLEAGNEGLTVSTSPSNAGNITVKFLSLSSNYLRYGRIETVARVQLTADAESDHILRSITFTNDQSARDMDLINLALETTSGKKLTNSAARMRGKQVTLQFEPTYILKRSQTVVLLLKAEVRGSITRKVDFKLEEESDLDAGPYRSRN